MIDGADEVTAGSWTGNTLQSVGRKNEFAIT
jgi:hypothetical protein